MPNIQSIILPSCAVDWRLSVQWPRCNDGFLLPPEQMNATQFKESVEDEIRRQQREHEKASQFESASIDAAKAIHDIDQMLADLHDIGVAVNDAWDEELEDTDLIDVYTGLNEITDEIYKKLLAKLEKTIKHLETATGKKINEFAEYIKD